jgi:threonine/homoserine/homoserine lactone efflux protein
MIPAQSSLAFFAASVLLALAPGPDNLFVLLQSAMHGRRAGVLVVLGLCTGLLFHTTAVALGLAAVFASSQAAFNFVKWLGAAYLCYLAWQAFTAPTGAAAATATGARTGAQLYRRGIVMNVTNPKVTIFFLAFLPQFIVPDAGSVALQVAWLGLLFILATLLVFGAIAAFAGAAGRLLRKSPRAEKSLNWLAGAVFAGLAIKLATAQR